MQIEEKKQIANGQIPIVPMTKSPTRRQHSTVGSIISNISAPVPTGSDFATALQTENEQLRTQLDFYKQIRLDVDELQRKRTESHQNEYRKPNFKIASPTRRRKLSLNNQMDIGGDRLRRNSSIRMDTEIRKISPVVSIEPPPERELPSQRELVNLNSDSGGCLESNSSFIYVSQDESNSPEKASRPVLNLKPKLIEHQSSDELEDFLMNFVNKRGIWN